MNPVGRTLTSIVVIASFLFSNSFAEKDFIIPPVIKNSIDNKTRKDLSAIIDESVDSTTSLGYVLLKLDNPVDAKENFNVINEKLISKMRDYINNNIRKDVRDYSRQDILDVFKKNYSLVRDSLGLDHNPDSGFINQAIESREASCLVLSAAFYLSVGDALGLPIHLVNIPECGDNKGHAFVRWDADGKHSPFNSDDPNNDGDVNWECSDGFTTDDNHYIDLFELSANSNDKNLNSLNTKDAVLLILEQTANNHLIRKNPERVRFYDHILALEPNNESALTNKAFFLYNNKNYKEAIPLFERYMGNYPATDNLLFRLGDSRYESGDVDGSIKDFEAALRHNPQHEEALVTLGHIMISKGRYGDALRMNNEAINVNPGNYIAYHNRGVAKKHLGDMKGGDSDIKKAKKLKRFR